MARFGRRKNLPGIPQVPLDAPASLRGFLTSLRESLAVRLGQEGDPLEKAVTRRELVEGGIATLGRGGFGNGNGDTPLSPTAPPFDYSPPPAPRNVQVNGGFDAMFITWDDPGLGYNYYAEVFRSKTDLLDLNALDGPKKIGSAQIAFFADQQTAGDTTPFYYWVRFVKAIGNRLIYGPFNSTNGSEGSITLDPTYIVESLNAHFSNRELNALKVDNNGYVIGWGYWNEGPNDNGIIFNAGAFACIDPSVPGTFDPETNYTGETLPEKFVFGYAKVDGIVRFAINAKTYIPKASITDLQVKNISVNKVSGLDANFISARINDATITTAKLANKIQSTQTIGDDGPPLWEINKNGAIITRSSDGTMIMNDTALTVHDADDNLRVKIGRLS